MPIHSTVKEHNGFGLGRIKNFVKISGLLYLFDYENFCKIPKFFKGFNIPFLLLTLKFLKFLHNGLSL